VKAGSAKKKKWTVMVFMVLDDQIAAMRKTAALDEGEMCAAGSTPHRNIVVQQHVIARRFTVGGANNNVCTPADTWPVGADNSFGTAATLAQFLLWSRDRFPADRYALILWGHSFELGFGALTTPGNTLQITELAEALSRFKAKTGRPIDIVGTSTCNYSTAEVVVGLSGLASYLVASEATIPFTRGWPFKKIIEGFTVEMSPKEIAVRTVDQFVLSFKDEPGAPVALTAIDVGKSPVLKKCMTNLARAILACEGQDKLFVARAFMRAVGNLLSHTNGVPKSWVPAVDLIDFAHELANDSELNAKPSVSVARLIDVAGQVESALTTNRLIIDNMSIVDNPHMHGILVLTPGASELLARILFAAPGGSPTPLDKFVAIEQNYLKDTKMSYPKEWSATGWPKVVKRINESLAEVPMLAHLS
jgi:hypothetical protein